jgi:acyl dehydratase
MNSYVWKDLHEGLEHRFEAEITPGMVLAFRTLSGDTNPLHGDAGFARAAGYADAVVFGMLTASLYSRLVGVHLPGKFALLHGVDVEFTAPVYVGEKLTVVGAITQLVEAYRRIEIRARILKADGTLASRAKLKAGLHEP